ncbi:hypothetical protein ABZP36_031299 [Zizania latifolia]
MGPSPRGRHGGQPPLPAARCPSLRAAVRLRFRTFYGHAADTVGGEDLRKSLARREYEALQDRISTKIISFERVSCINGMVPLLPSLVLAEFCSTSKDLQRNWLGYALVDKCKKKLAREWGITDLYVHVAINNEAAKKLYSKCGFVYESEELCSCDSIIS